MKKTDKKVGNWNYYVKVNPLSFGKDLLNKNIWGHWVYKIVPFVLILILLLALEHDSVLVMSDNMFSFSKDTSNSICMLFLFVISYYLSGSYPQWVKESLDLLIKYQKDDKVTRIIKKTTLVVQGLNLLSILGILAGIPFVLVAKNNGLDWMEEMNNATSTIYNLVLGMTWYFSIILFIYVMSGCFLLSSILEAETFSIFEGNYEVMCYDMQKVARIMNITISYSIFYVVGAFVIIINDNISTKDGLELTFYKYPIAAIVMVFILIVGFLYVLIPVGKFRKVIEKQKYKQLILIEDENISEEEKELKKRKVKHVSSSIIQNNSNRFLVIASALCPLLTLFIKEVPEFISKIF